LGAGGRKGRRMILPAALRPRPTGVSRCRLWLVANGHSNFVDAVLGSVRKEDSQFQKISVLHADA
jgi:hypothetical protein